MPKTQALPKTQAMSRDQQEKRLTGGSNNANLLHTKWSKGTNLSNLRDDSFLHVAAATISHQDWTPIHVDHPGAKDHSPEESKGTQRTTYTWHKVPKALKQKIKSISTLNWKGETVIKMTNRDIPPQELSLYRQAWLKYYQKIILSHSKPFLEIPV